MLNSSEHHLSELSRSHGGKDTYNWKSEENYSLSVKTTCQKIETKENFEFRHHIGISIKKLFLYCIFFVLFQQQVSPLDFPILSLCVCVCVCVCVCEIKCVLISNMHGGTGSLALWVVFANGPGDQGSVPGHVIPKT